MVTRWNSQLYMMRRLLELKTDLTAVCHGCVMDGKPVMAEKDISSYWPNENQWNVRIRILKSNFSID